jgi:hypothetical protein
VIFYFKKTNFRIGRLENKEKHLFYSTLVLELFFPSIASCRKLKIQKNPKIDFPYWGGLLMVSVDRYSIDIARKYLLLILMSSSYTKY